MNRPRDYLRYEPTEYANNGKRKVFVTAKQVEPWYSPNRPRNIVITAALFTSLIFIKPIIDCGRSFFASFRLMKEKKRINQELDEEERREAELLADKTKAL